MTNSERDGPPALADYFSIDYEPKELLEKWAVLRGSVAEAGTSTSYGRPSSKSKKETVGTPDGAGRYPRSSVALDTLYDLRRRSVTHPPDRSDEEGSFSSEAEEEESGESSSSSGSTYRRHHRYDEFSTAYEYLSDPYDRAQEVERQQKFIEESRRQAKPFLPSNRGGLEMPTRFLIGDCVRALYRDISSDWPEAEVMVVTTAEDLIAVYFSLYNLKKRQVALVLRYMNRALKCNRSIQEFHLSKVPEGWDVLTNDNHVLYTLRPPWVKKRPFLPNTVTPPTAHVTK